MQQTGAVIIGSQRDTRYIDTYTDQHAWTKGPKADVFRDGRPWTGYREFASERGNPEGFVTAELQKGAFYEHDREKSFASAWDAPWSPESEYFDFNHRTKKIKLRYDKCIGKYGFFYRQYFDAAAKLAGANGWGEITFGVIPKFQITAIVGLPPISPRIPEAAMAGDPWLLGFEEEPNPVLARLLNKSIVSEGIYAPEVAPITPLASPERVINMTPDELARLVDEAVERRLAQTDKPKGGKKTVASAEAA